MGDDEDGFSPLFQPLENHSKVINLLWCQHGGWFIQNDDVRPTVESLDNLHPLLHAKGYVLHQSFGINGNAIIAAHFIHLFLSPTSVIMKPVPGFIAKHNIVRNR